MITGRDDLIHARRSAPTLLRKREVHTHADDLHVRKLSRLLVEALGLQVTHRSVQRRNRGHDPGLARGPAQGVLAEIDLLYLEVRGGLPDLDLISKERDGISFECARSHVC